MAIPYTSSYDKTISFSDTCKQIALTAGVIQTITIPGNATNNYTVLFGMNETSNIFIGKNMNAATPAANTITSLQYVELRPKKRYVVGGDVISFITPDATAYVGVSLRSIP